MVRTLFAVDIKEFPVLSFSLSAFAVGSGIVLGAG
jgi:hypothetical protein